MQFGEHGEPGVDHRVDALTGAEVIVTAARQGRPNLPTGDCPFCPGGLEAPETYAVRWFENRWPPLPDGRAEIVLYTPDHDATFWSLGIDSAARVVRLWTERTAALGARPDVGYVLVFENRGAAVGATIAHPHGQIYAYRSVPPAPRRELDGPCHLCTVDPQAERLVAGQGDWRAWVPAAAAWPYELRMAPAPHVPDLVAAAPSQRDLAALLVDVLARLDALFAEPMPYMLWVHQRPTDGGEWPAAHLHLHLAPYHRAPGTPRFVAAGELGGGTYFNPVDPADAAAALRAAR